VDKIKALNTLLDLKRSLDSLNIPFWLDGGTLLGAYRENDFLASDFDIDIGIKGEHDKQFSRLIEVLKHRGFSNFHLKEHPCGEGKQLSWVKDGIPGDIFVYYLRGDSRWRLLFDHHPLRTVKFIPCVYPAYLFDRFEHIDFIYYGVEFNMPSPTEKYLELQYGDWKIDKSTHEFHWQTDYKSMDMGFEIYPKPKGKKRWIFTDKLLYTPSDGTYFIPLIKEGYKLYPIEVNNLKVVDGNKRVSAYKQLGVPMVECICTNLQ
jgi:hypothetical protein